MPIITLASSKGGAGKTTIAELLIAALAREGARVAALDADPTRTLHRWLTGAYDGPAVACEAETDEARLGHRIADLAERAEVVVVDTAGFGNIAANVAMAAADGVLVPMAPGEADVTEAERTVRMVEALARTTRRPIPCRVVLNRAQEQTTLTRHVAAEAERAGLPLLAARLGHRVASYGELGFTGRLPRPRDAAAAAEVAALVAELRGLGWVPEVQDA